MTIFSVCWTLFSVGVVVGEIDAWRHGIREYAAVAFTSTIVLVHIVAIIFTAYLWRTEKSVPTHGIEGSVIDDLLDMKPEEIDIEKEKLRLKRIIIGEISSFFSLMIFVWSSHTGGVLGAGVLFGGILFLHIVGETIRYLILRSRAATSSE